jgi:XTP/dITP diphosphohydrolase
MSRTLVVLSTRLGAVLPAAALPALRAAERVYADYSVPESLMVECGAQRRPDGWHAYVPLWREVLLTTNSEHHMRPYAAAVIETPEPDGAELLDAVAVMDRLRSPGGCLWDAEQTHTSLLQYLVEECYELHEAIEDTDRSALREELGDVLLQVLFHARLAAEGAVAPFLHTGGDVERFDVDDVARDLVRKLISRHPHVFEAEPATVDQIHTATDQERRWDELKRVEKSRDSALDGVALGQPAVALVAKLISRARKAGLPEELVRRAATEGDGVLFDAVATAKLAGRDPEQELRASARSFDRSVRAAERAARAEGLDPHHLTEADWHRCLPH